jgi:diguanylate cyclase (GGDEF)-like protein/PAS domain S-box-containing protein
MGRPGHRSGPVRGAEATPASATPIFMPTVTPSSPRLRGWLRWIEPYHVDESLAGRFRARQVQAVQRLTRLAMGANLLNALAVLLALNPRGARRDLLVWGLVVAAMSLQGLVGWWRAQRRGPRPSASRRALRRLTLHSALLAGVWAALPLLVLPGGEPEHQLLASVVTAGMMCAGGFLLATVPAAGMAYVGVLGLGGAAALALSGLQLAPLLTVLLLSYTAVVMATVWATARLFGARLVAEADAGRQGEIVGLLLRDFAENAADVLWEIDAQGRLRAASDRLAALLGQRLEVLQGRELAPLLAAAAPATDEAQRHLAELRGRLDDGAPFRDQLLAVRVGGEPRWWQLSAKPLSDEGGRGTGWRGVITDVTAAHSAHRQLRWLAHNDTLTGLRNRHQFRQELAELLQGRRHWPPHTALLGLDLDHFKNVNDTLGHAVGDELLREVARRLQATVRRGDTVARMGGDEFAVLLRQVADRREVQALAQRLVETLSQPYAVGSSQLVVGCSIGIAMADEASADTEALLRHADQALYAAKAEGRGTLRFFSTDMAQSTQRRQQLEQALRGALATQALSLVYQPLVALEGDRVVGFEALLRWQHPQLGAVSPAEFIPVAEDCGLMPEIGRWVLRQACAEAARWPSGLTLSVNVSPVQVMASDLPAIVREATSAAGLPPSRLELEITESAFLQEGAGTADSIRTLHEAGVRLALDDFGTGYSALAYLRRYPFDTLKIDRSFVRDMLGRSDADAIVGMIVGLGRSLKLRTVAEGVEEPAQAEALRRHGCSTIQGYLVARPMPPAEVPAFLARHGAASKATAPAAPT